MATLEEERKPTGNLREFYQAQTKPIAQSVGEGVGEVTRAAALGAQKINNVGSDAVGSTLAVNRYAGDVLNRLPGKIAAPIANTASQVIAGAQSAFTGQNYKPQQFEAKPMFGGASSPVAAAAAAPVGYANPNPNGSGGMIRPQTPVVPKAQGVAAPAAPTPQFIQTQWNKPAPAARAAKPRPTISGMAARTTPAAQTPAAPAQAAPAADYYDGRANYIRRAYDEAAAQRETELQQVREMAGAKNEFGRRVHSDQQLMDMMDAINKKYPSQMADNGFSNSDTVNKSRATFESIAMNDYEKSPEYKKMQSLGDQSAARNNPNDMATWGPIDVVNGIRLDSMYRKPDATLSYSKEKGTFEDQDARDEYDANEAARDSLMSKKVGEPLTQREAAYLQRAQAELQREAMGNQTTLTQQGMSDATSRSNNANTNATSRGNQILQNEAAKYRVDNSPLSSAADPWPDIWAKSQEMLPDEERTPYQEWLSKQGAAQTAKPTPRAQYEALPPGSIYIGPDGKRYVKGK